MIVRDECTLHLIRLCIYPTCGFLHHQAGQEMRQLSNWHIECWHSRGRDQKKITALLRRFKSLKSLTIICIPGRLDTFVSKLVRTRHGYRAPKMTAHQKHRIEWCVLDNWRYSRPDNWWNKLPRIKMNIVYLYHDTLRDPWPLTEDERCWELAQIIQLGKLGLKINDHMQDMETWTEEF